MIEPAFERFPDAREVGDEPILIALRAGVPVMVSADRALGAAHAIERLGATVILLDDGFQHWRLARDLDIALLDAERPLGNGRLLPAGPLREPSESLRRAGLVVAVHGPGSPAHVAVASLLAELGAAAPPRIDVEVVPTSVGPLAPRRPAVARDTARVVPGAAEEAGRLGPEGAVDTPDLALSGRRVALIAAIARPERFSRTVASLGAAVVHETFLRDHAVIGSEALARFREGAARAGADLLLTTEKDAVRLGSSAPSDLSVLAIEHRIITGAGVLDRKLSEVAVVDAAEERPSEIAHG